MSWSELKLYFGKLLNVAGFPGLVRECAYHSRALNAVVKVRKLGLYTVITVNGVDVYFTRFTGRIDGVGTSLASGCTVTEGSECNHPEQPPSPSCPPPQIQSKIP